MGQGRGIDMTKIVHARLNEKGEIMYGLPGDQTGEEVVKQDFYESAWHTVYRAKETAIAKHMARNAEAIAKNDAFGYGQDDRYSGFYESLKVNFDFSAVTTPCAFDCSSMVMTLLVAAGINVPKAFYTWNMHDYMIKTGQFKVIPYTKGMALKQGDIVLKTGHVVIVVEGDDTDYPEWVGECYGAEFVTVRTAPDDKAGKADWSTLGTGNLFGVIGEDGDWYRIRIAEKYEGYIPKRNVLRKTVAKTGIVISDVYVRANAGASYKALGILKKGTTAEICDTKKAANGADWYYIKYKDAWGFSSAKYIK